MPTRRRRLSAFLPALSLVLPLGLLVAPGAAAAAPRSELPPSAGGSVAADDPPPVPAPPIDIVGRPAASTVVRTDGLMITGTSTAGQVNSRWAQPKPDLTGLKSQGKTGTQTVRPPITAPVTRSARLLDPQTDRVLSLQHSGAGPDGLWQLAATNSATEPEWHGKDVDQAAPRPGNTYTLTLDDGTSLSEVSGSPEFGHQLQVARADVTSTRQQWTLLADPDEDGWFRLASRSDGMCVNLLDSNSAQNAPVGAWPCPETSRFDSNEVWKPVAVPGKSGSYTFVNRASQKLLTRIGGALVGQHSADESLAGGQQWSVKQIVEPSGTVPTWSDRAVSSDPGLASALATGDLDRAVGTDGQYGDEAVVVSTDADHRMQVRVVDYKANDNHLMVTAPSVQLPVVGTTVGGTWYAGSLGAAVGDFDGDLLNDLAVTWQDAKGFHATIMQYRASDDARTLTVTNDVPLFAASGYSPVVVTGLADTTAGDFDGDDRDDLAIAFAAPPTGGGKPVAVIGVTTFTEKMAIGPEAAAEPDLGNRIGTILLPAAGVTWTNAGLRAVPGLFHLDEQAGYTMHRRQLAVVWTDRVTVQTSYAQWFASILEVQRSNQGKTLSVNRNTVLGAENYQDVNAALASPPTAVTAGGFQGRGSGSSIPLWGVAVASSGFDGFSGKPAPTLTLLRPAADRSLHVVSSNPDNDSGGYFSLTAYDQAGTSLVLGAPVVMSVNQLVRATLVGAQPPAHSDWLDGKFVNVSRKPDFAVKLGSSQEESANSAYTTKASSTIGVTEGFDAKATLETGLFGLESVGSSIEVAQKFSKDWEADQVDTSKYSRKTSFSEKATSNDDDIVDALQVTNTVYRYPILGGPATTTDGKPVQTPDCTANCYGYYEVTIPGAVTKINGFGRSDEWYQPSWQNGNALSYPQLEGSESTVPTPDVGDYSFVGADGKTVTGKGVLFNESNDLGGGSRTYDLEISEAAGGGHERTSGGSMSNSAELKVGLDVKAGIGAAKGKAEFEVSAGVDTKSTWATTESSDTETSSSSTFGLEVPTVPENMGYRVGTTYYVDTAGVQKVVHGVALDVKGAQGSEWWGDHYGRTPDLALNLPLSTIVVPNALGVADDPKWSPQRNRQRIRGFWAVQPTDPASPATSGVPYATNPHQGDAVSFAVQVHNYSLVDAAAAPAYFYAVPVDKQGLDVTGEPQLIGKTTVPALTRQAATTISSPPWTAVGPPAGGGLQNWRIFVILDPDNTLKEVHPWKGQPSCPEESVADGTSLVDPMTDEEEVLACGQNNQGYGEVTVMGDALGDSRHRPRVTLAGGRLLLNSGQRAPRSAGVRPVVNQQVQGIVHVTSTGNTADISHVLVYDGDPDQGGELIAHAKLSGADAVDGGYARYSWRPTEPGRHVLHQVLVTGTGEEQEQELRVDVRRHGPAARLTLAPGTATVPPGTPVRFTTNAWDAYGNRLPRQTRGRLSITPEGHCRLDRCWAREPGRHRVTVCSRQLVARTELVVTRPRRDKAVPE